MLPDISGNCASITSSCKLDFNFDPQALRTDLAQIRSDEWVSHFNKGYFEGQWIGIALRSIGGSASRLYSDQTTSVPYQDTPVLDRCPNVRALLKTFRCPLRSVRFLKLEAGAVIREHRDYSLGFEFGQIRLHIPLVTNDKVDFFLDAHRIPMQPGECWYLDLSLPHWVENRGASDRVHLVIDCEVNEWLRRRLPPPKVDDESIAEASYESSPAELERFRQVVHRELELQQRLRQTADRESFIRLVVSLGRQRGYRFAAADAENAMRAAQQSGTEGWMD